MENEEVILRSRIEDLKERYKRQIDHNESFYAVRIQAISDLAKKHGIWNEVAAILANGKISPEDPPTYDHMLAREKARANKAEANYRWMVERAADQRLDGYRELGARCAVESVMNVFRLVLGDWSGDGHGRTSARSIQTSLSLPELVKAFKLVQKKLGMRVQP